MTTHRRNAHLLADARQRVARNFPKGADTESATQIPVLLMAIDKLQQALAPFAKIAASESAVSIGVGENHVVQCRLTDCVTARKLLVSMSDPGRITEDFGLPAES